ncbi:rhodanese-like domain-containing protein [Oceanobacillus halophilus]|uniref:Rhodanese-like domain-containing protein n=1 Tax=Oceanobacillus halophilus TaxID=930130 RepID=A0A495A383_9BACI|nr:rhodanese-like domain-containing protein [Oceanobacillus halophilus]RKQ34017.1 rhodanese-like domain-containing protein [Oceanobacillus halophilus]
MKTIQPDQLLEKIKKGENVNIIDVREDLEVAAGKIPEANHIPLGDIPHSLDKLDKNKHYYMVCHSGGRSSSACEYLVNQGYDVTNMIGGMLAWPGETK